MIYRFGNCTLDEERHELRRAGEVVAVEPKVFEVLIYFLQHRERVITKVELFEQCWPDMFVSEWALTRCLTKLRRAVQPVRNAPPVLKTVHRQGYRLVAEVTVERHEEPVEEARPAGPFDAMPGPMFTEPSPGVKPQATILVVDDDVKHIRLMQAMLKPKGYRVLTVSNGEEALHHVGQDRPDLILLDVMMPIMDGFEVCTRLKDDPDTRLIPVVLMTALGQVEDRIRGIEAGADDFLTKPVHPDELLARIRTSLRLKRTIEHRISGL